MPSENHFLKMLDISRRMLDAGNRQDWDTLIQLEQQRRTLQSNRVPPATVQSAERITDLIHQIQQCDAQLMDKAEAWLKHARILLRTDAPTPPEMTR